MPAAGPSKEETEAQVKAAREYADQFVLRCRLREVAQKRNLTNVREIYRRTGVHYSILDRLMNEETERIDFDTMKRLVLGLNASLNELFEIDVKDDTNEK